MTQHVTDRFAGQVAVVVGAGSGIGAAVARRVAAEGATTVVVDVVAENVASVADSIGGASGHAVDVADPAAVEALFDAVVAQHGRVDVVVNTAGVDDPVAKDSIRAAGESGQPVDVLRELDDARWRRVMAINLDGTFHVVRAAARRMVPQGSGSIVLIGSSAAFDTLVGYPHYAASKAGVHALAQAAAKELAPHGIRVNVVAPGPVDTPMAGRTPASVREAMAASGAVGYASPEELADNILYLASPGASNVIGAVLLSNGGRFTV
ncbi:SDR family NAD(P)-dependent oxidoreductase [Aeromicrobium alkaliterrae]|uniref:SDR family oxidoreductase n=1 Tax=Aeromicrobium alkaliterrae TaxID=302168 RepID=A0ABN2JEL3_9ACTN